MLDLEEELGKLDRIRGDAHRLGLDIAYQAILKLFPDDARALLYTGIRAYEDGKRDLARSCLDRAALINPESTTYLYLGKLKQESADFAGAAADYKRAAELNPTDPAIRLNLALVEGALCSFPEALDEVQHAIELGDNSAYANFLLAGALVRNGRFEEANDVCSRGLAIPLSPTVATNTRILRCGSAYQSVVGANYPSDIPSIPNIEVSKDTYDVVYFVCCDGVYFDKFFTAAASACARHSGRAVLFHVHIVNPPQDYEDQVRAAASQEALQIVVTTERIAFHGKSDQTRRTFLACRRFAFLPDLIRAHGNRQVLCADADQLILKPLEPFLESCDQDIALVHDPLNALNLLSLFSATVMVIRPTDAAIAFCENVRRYIAHFVQSDSELDWHLDQAALSLVFLHQGDGVGARVKMLPASVVSGDASAADSDGCVFWSITYSVPGNATKLKSSAFRKYAERKSPASPAQPIQTIQRSSAPRIVLVSTSIPPGPSGQARVLGHVLAAAPSDGCLLLADQSPFPPGIETVATRHPYRLLAQRTPHLRDGGWLPQRFPRMNYFLGMLRSVIQRAGEIGEHVRNFSPSVLVACTASPFDLPATTLVALRYRIPLVVYLFDDPIFQWVPGHLREFARLWEPLWSRLARQVIVPNDSMSDEYSARRHRRPVIVRNPIPREALGTLDSPWPTTPGHYRIVYTGSVYHAQSDAFLNLISALRALDDWSLHIYSNQSAQEVAAYGIEGPNIFHHPHVDQEESYGVQRDADVLFLPLAFHSQIQDVLRTSAPGKMGEYLASGRPVLVHAPADTFIARHFLYHQAGVVVTQPTAAALTKALNEIASDPEVRDFVTGNARRLAEQYFADRAQNAFWEAVESTVPIKAPTSEETVATPVPMKPDTSEKKPILLSPPVSEPAKQTSMVRVQFENVIQSYRVIRGRPDTLREVVTGLFSRKDHHYDFDALKNVSFQIGDGEVLGIIGHNGSGKSTTLKIIAGVYRPSHGSVSVNGKVAALIELGAGFHPDLTGRENIIINGLMLGLSRRQLRQREDKIIDFAALGDFIDSPVKQYSSGMFMRLGFAIATEVDPDILLIDEILSVGDVEFQEKCQTRIDDFRQRGKTIVLVSHATDTIKALCSRALVLDHGHLVFDGSPADAVDRYVELMKHPSPPDA